MASRVAQSLGLVLPNISPPPLTNAARSGGTCLPICYTQREKAWSVKCGWAERCKGCDECTGPPSEEWTRADEEWAGAMTAMPRHAAARAAHAARAWQWPWEWASSDTEDAAQAEAQQQQAQQQQQQQPLASTIQSERELGQGGRSNSTSSINHIGREAK